MSILGGLCLVPWPTADAGDKTAADAPPGIDTGAAPGAPFLRVLGIAQDAGVPQAGSIEDAAWHDPARRRHATSLAVVDPVSNERLLFEATPDFKYQLRHLDERFPVESRPGIDGIFLTHAHIGHYTGLMMLGHEVMGAKEVPVYAMPRMAEFLTHNGPWSQLVRYRNIVLRPLVAGQPVQATANVSVTPFLVPHRQEFSEVVGYRIAGPNRTVLFIPDIDRWEDWQEDLASLLGSVDVAYLDATFYANGEIPGRDMSGFPHPFITTTMQRLAHLPAAEKGKVRFIHFNHTNPVLDVDSAAAAEVRRQGFKLAAEGEELGL